MLTREQAEQALSQVEYRRQNVGPSKEKINSGIYMPVYFSPDIAGAYAYGDRRIEGYICPERYIRDIEYIRSMIGYSGKILIQNP